MDPSAIPTAGLAYRRRSLGRSRGCEYDQCRPCDTGSKVVLCFTNFTASEIDAIVSTPAYQTTFIQQSLAIVKAGNGDGININFEGINSSSKAALTQFMIALADSFHANIPGLTGLLRADGFRYPLR